MNCKPGDLAVIVGSYGDDRNIGKLVECLRWYTDGDGEPRWHVRRVSSFPPDMANECDDKFLRPIRDNPGEDETLTWKPLPVKETA